MSNMSISIDNNKEYDIEVYTHDIFYYADEYINKYLQGTTDKEILKSEFKSIIYYIRHRIPKPDNNNIQLLDDIFCNVYLELCARCNIIPTLEAFSWLLNINPNTLSAWKNGEYRKLTPEFSLSVKKWLDICKGQLTYELSQSKGGDINRIFIAKAVYGLAETAPVQVQNTTPALSLNNEQLAARLGGRVEEIEVLPDDSG